MSSDLHVRELITQLTNSGMNESAIAKSTGSAQSTINRVHKGVVDCRYSLFLKIRRLHEERLGNKIKRSA